MASKIQICNRALSKLGADRITSLDDDTKAARAMKSAFDFVRDAELRAHVWNFSVTRIELAALSTEPVWGFSYEYAMPDGFLKLLEIRGLYGNANTLDYRTTPAPLWQMEGGVLRTDIEAPIYIRYVAQITDTGLYDSLFSEALACRLAAETAEEITESSTKVGNAWKLYERAVREALKADAIEQPTEWMNDDSWVLGRL
jgi:hypothetical protein